MCLRRLKWPALDGLSFSYHFLLFENFVHACDGFFLMKFISNSLPSSDSPTHPTTFLSQFHVFCF